MVAGLVAAFSGPAIANVTGLCANCHTMHNSQGGNTSLYGPTPEPTLLVNTCLGCHSSDSSSTTYDLDGSTVPVVNYIGAEPTEYLAGGNFYWVKEGNTNADDSKGHNVFLDENDSILSEAPGKSDGCGNKSCHMNLSEPYQGSAWPYIDAGDYGCKGCHLNERHHADDDSSGGLVTTAEQGWYRFLSGHSYIGKGVHGYEDPNWEAGQPNLATGAANHNEYLGSENTADSSSGFNGTGGNGTTAFCTGCHGDFHTQQESNAWIRHPSDAVIGREDGPEEYKHVGGDTHVYDPLSPVARPSLSGSPGANVTPGTDMVMCLSCHRPHGSPYADILRWDYAATEAQGGGDDTGCFYCHTQKNDPG